MCHSNLFMSLFILLKDPIDIKKATGIPRGFLVPVDGPSVPGAMLTGLGTFAVPSIDQYVFFVQYKYLELINV